MACLERRCACRVRCRCAAASRRPPEPHAIVAGSSSLDSGNRARPVDRSARLSWVSIVSRKFCRRWIGQRLAAPGAHPRAKRLWCKRQDLARYDVGRAAGGVGMGKLMGVEQLFEGRHFDREVIILCVRWYLRFKLSLRDLVEMMAERGLSLAHTTILRWVERYTAELVKRWNRFGTRTGRSWRVDETYLKIRDKWVDVYGAVDRAGQTVDFMLVAMRDVAAGQAAVMKQLDHTD